jgi:hypothetical protein
VPAFLAVCLVALAVLGLGFCAVRKMKPTAFRLRTTLLRVFSFSMEIESSSVAGKLVDVPGHAQGLARSGEDGALTESAEPQSPARE